MPGVLSPEGAEPEGATQQGGEPNAERNWITSVPGDLREKYSSRLEQFNSFGEVLETGFKSMADLEELQKKYDPERAFIPSEEDGDEAWGAFWNKLGRPENAAGYGIEEEDISKIYMNANLTAKQAEALSAGLTKYNEQNIEDYKAKRKESYEKTVGDLKTKYGDEYDVKMRTAQTALQRLGGDALVNTMREKGLDNDPDMIGFFVGLGELMQEGNIPAGMKARSKNVGLTGSYDSMKGID